MRLASTILEEKLKLLPMLVSNTIGRNVSLGLEAMYRRNHKVISHPKLRAISLTTFLLKSMILKCQSFKSTLSTVYNVYMLLYLAVYVIAVKSHN